MHDQDHSHEAHEPHSQPVSDPTSAATVTTPIYKPPSKSKESKNLIIFILCVTFLFLVISNVIIFLFPITAVENLFYNLPSLFSVFSLSSPVKPSPTPLVSVTPSVTTTPHETANVDTTYGTIEQISCQQLTGYAYDPAKNEEAMSVSFYADGSVYRGALLGKTQASDPRPDIRQRFSIQGDHGFHFSGIAQDGKEHSYYAYITAKDGTVHPLGNSPQYITCPQ